MGGEWKGLYNSWERAVWEGRSVKGLMSQTVWFGASPKVEGFKAGIMVFQLARLEFARKNCAAYHWIDLKALMGKRGANSE